MTVKFPAQVLSSTVSKALVKYGEDTVATAKFCKMIDMWFDCMNNRCQEEAKRKTKPFLEPYRSTQDTRFKWLKIKEKLGADVIILTLCSLVITIPD